MSVIGFSGTSGVGKSFLVKQLSSLTSNPAIFEGEEGTIPKKIFTAIFNSKNPIKRWKWFIKRYENILKKAHKISLKGINCYVDACVFTAKAMENYEEVKYRKELDKMVKGIQQYEADKVILLVASKKTIEKNIKTRARKQEELKPALKRAMKLQDNYIIEAKNNKKVRIINREKLNFSNEKDLVRILKIINKK